MNKFCQKSIEIARALYPDLRDERRTFHWTFIWHGSKLLTIGENKQKTSPRNLRNAKGIKYDLQEKACCSELSAFIRLKNQSNIAWKKLSFINVRINREGGICMSKPCRYCQSLFNYIMPKEIFYTNQEGKFEKYS